MKKDIKLTRDELTQLIQGFALHGLRAERERILAIVKAGEWAGESLAQDISNLEALIKGENK